MMILIARRRRNFLGVWRAFYTKNTSPPGGLAPAAGGIFFGHLGGVVHKNHVAGMHSETCFWRKTPPKSSKISASGEGILKYTLCASSFVTPEPHANVSFSFAGLMVENK